ncbi:cytochrome P450 [Iningainema tapete]|uniref:Cytochrome P450 n=1 Tax=Iningainema tapete BLCC-T55 TaxID=2748662 RepID=A0A8J6XQB4_9CYAN|nr:cytochrome P450 [Iningainema tapete]MBD2771433.1 cytochrome P450 [Iningainema tapete BLCC-T55]
MQQLKSAQQMPGSFGVPILSDLQFVATEGYGLIEGLHRYGPVFKTSIIGQKCAVLIGPEANRLVLQEQADCLSSYLGWRFFMEHVFGRPMMIQDGQQHMRTRRLMTPAFHSAALTSYFQTMETIASASLKDWATRGEINLSHELRKATLLVGIQLLLGVQAQQEIEEVGKYYNELLKGAIALLRFNVPFTTYGRSQIARQKLKNQLQEIIAQRRQQGLQATQDVLGLFLATVDEDGNSLPEEQIMDELIHLVNGSHFTTAGVLSWAMFELAARPEWRDRLQQELNQVVGKESLNVGHLRQLTQMTYFLKEIERLYPPTSIIVRGVVKEIEYAGYRIEPGWSIIISQFLTHRLPEIYTNPEQFDPERFAPGREEDKKIPFSLVGFGGGAHICIGREFALMEIKIFLALLLRQYHWTITPEYSQLAPVLVPPKAQEKLRAKMAMGACPDCYTL